MSKTQVSQKTLGKRLQDALASAPDHYLQCRDTRHVWTVTKNLHVVKQDRSQTVVLVERHLECSRCKTERSDTYEVRTDRWGITRLENLGSGYRYPKDYLIKEMAAVEHPREVLLHEQLRRALAAG